MIYSLQTHIQMYVDPYEYIYISISIPVFKTYAASHMALAVKNLPANAGDVGLIPGLERSPEEGNGNPFQYSCLEKSMDRGAWLAIAHGVTKSSDTTE